MELVQVYEATVTDRQNGYAFTFLVIPKKSLTCSIQADDPPAKDALAQSLGLLHMQPVRPSSLPQAIAGMIRADDAPEEFQKVQGEAVLAQVLQTASQPVPPPALPADLLTFAEQIAFANLVP